MERYSDTVFLMCTDQVIYISENKVGFVFYVSYLLKIGKFMI